jgi:hypothetical protein
MNRAWLIAMAAAAAVASCGDVQSDLITRAGGPPASCAGDKDCSPPAPHCEIESGRCVECLDLSHCSDGRACALPAGTCVPGCPEAPCPLASPVCEEATGLCRGCTANTECPATSAFCQLATGRCVECVAHTDCPGGDFKICASNGLCVECTEAGHCSGDETCSPLNLCAVRCGPNGACPIDDPICDEAIGFCVECRTDSDCVDPDEACRNSDCVDRLTGR